ncbi:GDSL-type esterase/lipase family protein [Streptomyces sp. NPDC004539]|uniref:GDSL-type esterase/lipase family protein n=1 Tax=Streptomyces sp. NPDC004539 TaxID=3154280 RepID=UPI0033B41D96
MPPKRPLVLVLLLAAALAAALATAYATAYADQPGETPEPGPGTVVVLGASVAAGYRATPGAEWPAQVSRRLRRAGSPARLVNHSIGATLLLTDNGEGRPSALNRLRRDALDVPGVRTVVLTDLINDIQWPPHVYDPRVLERGLASVAFTVHARGVRLVVATIPPYGGFVRHSPEGERCRRAVNDFIRTSRLFDGVLDFDAVLADPADPARLRPAYDSGDHLHPGDRGHDALAREVDPRVLTGVRTP